MIKSILLLLLDVVLIAIVVFSYVFSNELAIKPLNEIKRRLLVNMSKRKVKLDLPKENDDSTNLEEDNNYMKRLEKIISHFRIKYIIFAILLIGITAVICYYSHLEISAILVTVVASIFLVYLLSRLAVLRDDAKEMAYDSVKKYLKIDEKYMKMIKEKNDEKNEDENLDKNN